MVQDRKRLTDGLTDEVKAQAEDWHLAFTVLVLVLVLVPGALSASPPASATASLLVGPSASSPPSLAPVSLLVGPSASSPPSLAPASAVFAGRCGGWMVYVRHPPELRHCIELLQCDGNCYDSESDVCNFRLIVHRPPCQPPPLFADGWEGGDCAAWTSVVGHDGGIFRDGFETGDFSAWSSISGQKEKPWKDRS